MRLFLILVLSSLCIKEIHGQAPTDPVALIDLDYNANFTGFELFNAGNNRAVIIAEDVHNRQAGPALTLKFLQFLNLHNDIRTLCIEGGTSTAYLINLYLESQDTVLLREIVRHTFYWSQEHYQFFIKLATWNKTLPSDKKITVKSADIEIKQESVILAMNILLEGRTIPPKIAKLETFRAVFKDKEGHKNKYQALNVRYYYDKEKCSALVNQILQDINVDDTNYKNFFQERYDLFKTMMKDLQTQYEFNYRSNYKFKFRDDIIYTKLVNLTKTTPEGFLYIVGFKHAREGSSSFRLKFDNTSPVKGQVLIINTTGRKKNGTYMGAKDVTQIATHYPRIFSSGNVLIKNDGRNQTFTQFLDYTLALENNLHVKAFKNSYTGK